MCSRWVEVSDEFVVEARPTWAVRWAALRGGGRGAINDFAHGHGGIRRAATAHLHHVFTDIAVNIECLCSRSVAEAPYPTETADRPPRASWIRTRFPSQGPGEPSGAEAAHPRSPTEPG